METAGRGGREILLTGLMLALLAFVAYYPILNNFFTWDDFLWLYRAKTLTANPLQMFAIDAVYFDPLVYLWFWIDYQLYGLNPFWYHLGDVAVHAGNGFLVYLLVRLLAQDHLAALASGILFVSSFAVVDAVAWSSSRVDLMAVFFSLLTLLFFLRYLDGGNRGVFVMSVASFVLAFGAKGTPLLLPGLLAVILVQRRELKRSWRLLLPYLVAVLAYLTLLGWRLEAAGKPLLDGAGGGLSMRNLTLSFVELFVPEHRLATLATGWVAAGLAVLVCLSCFLFAARLRWTAIFGLALMAVGLAPVLILKDFKLATSIHDAGHLLNSPSHRIYLASVGAACLGGVLVTVCARRWRRSWPGYALLFLVSIYSIYEIRLRSELWSGSARYIRNSVEGLAVYRQQLLDDSAIGLVNFPMSRGFTRPALALYCGLERVLFLPMAEIPAEIPDSPEIFRYRNRGFFFVYDGTRVTNLSAPFGRLLDVAFFYQVNREEGERARLFTEYRSLATEINEVIASAEQKQSVYDSGQ